MGKKRRLLPREEREKQLIDEAIKVFSAKGYVATSVTDIVESAGVARGTFYHYFDSKEEIFLRIIDIYFENLNRILETNSVRIKRALISGSAFLYAWLDFALDFFRFHRDNINLTSIIYRQAMGQEASFSEKLEGYALYSRRVLAAELRMLAERGFIIQCDFDVAAAIITGAALEIIMHFVTTNRDYDLDRIAFELVKNQSRALAANLREADRILETMEKSLYLKPSLWEEDAKNIPSCTRFQG